MIAMQLRHSGVLGGLLCTVGTAHPSNHAAHRTECIALLISAVQAVERRRVAGTLMGGTCAAAEVAWNEVKQYNPQVTGSDAAGWAALVGYEQFLRAASNACCVLASARLFAAECSAAQFQFFTQHVVRAAELMQQPRRHINVGLGWEAEFPMRLRGVAAVARTNGLDARLVRLLAATWQRLQRSGVLEERRIDFGITEVARELQTFQAAVQSSLNAPGLRHCALPGCGAKEAHPAHFKSCAACRAVVYCCREHQVEGWSGHKRACKAARKAQAEDGAESSSA